LTFAYENRISQQPTSFVTGVIISVAAAAAAFLSASIRESGVSGNLADLVGASA